MMERKNLNKTWALVAALVAASNGYGFAATQVDLGTGGTAVTTGTADTLNVTSTLPGSPQIVNVDGTLNVKSLSATTASTVGVSGSTAPQIWTTVPAGPSAISSYWTVTVTGEATATTAASGGGATVDKNGNIVLQGGSSTTTVAVVDYGFKTDINSDPGTGTSYGTATASTTVTGTYNTTAGTFTPGTGASAATTVDTVGGNLLMEGILTQGPVDANTNLPQVNGTNVFGQLSTSGGVLRLVADTNTNNLDGQGLYVDTNTGVVTLQSNNGVSVNGQKVINVAAGTAATDAVNYGQLSTEASTRSSVDTVLSTSISTEVSTRASADVVLSTAINTEASTRASADVVLSSAINTEASTRASADVVLGTAISTEVSTRTALIHQESDGIHIGANSLVYSENYFAPTTEGGPAGDRLFTTDGGGLTVTETFSVKPATNTTETVTTTPGEGQLPKIQNGDGTSTVSTRTGTVEVKTVNTEGGGTVMDTMGNVTMSQATTSGVTVEYITATQFLVDNATGEPIEGTLKYVGGYIDPETRQFVTLGELDESGQLNLDELSEEELAAISNPIRTTKEGGNLEVGGDAKIDGTLNMTNGKITNVADGTAPKDAVNKGQLDAVQTQLHNEIVAETDARIAADENLQKQIDKNTKDIDDLQDELKEVAAMSAAMSALVPNDRAAGNTQVSVGLGYYDSEGAAALGIFHYLNDNVLLNAGASASFNGGNVAGRAGITIGF